MNTSPPVEARGLGDNQPPEGDAITLRLRETHQKALARRDELLAEVDTLPEAVTSDDEEEAASDVVKDLQGHAKSVERTRVDEKEPFLEGGRRVDGFFNDIKDSLNEAKRRIEKRLTAYQRAKADEERKRRAEEERQRREEAERARQEAERRAAEAEDDEGLDGAIDAEEEARRQAADAERAAREAGAKAADMSRSRSARGTVASLRTFWTFRNLERETLALEPLRQHLPQGALEQAVRSYIAAGGRALDGVEIYEDHQTVVR